MKIANSPTVESDLEIGKTYKVSFDDCCITGWFVGIFIASEGPGKLKFSTGKVEGYIVIWEVFDED